MSEFITINSPITVSYHELSERNNSGDLGLFNNYSIFMKSLAEITKYFEEDLGMVIGWYHFAFFDGEGNDDLVYEEYSRAPSGKSISAILKEYIEMAEKRKHLNTLILSIYLCTPNKIKKINTTNYRFKKEEYDPSIPEGSVRADYEIRCVVSPINRINIEGYPI
jgi:hypothetical protein